MESGNGQLQKKKKKKKKEFFSKRQTFHQQAL